VKSSQVKTSQVKTSQVKTSQVKSSQVKTSQVKTSEGRPKARERWALHLTHETAEKPQIFINKINSIFFDISFPSVYYNDGKKSPFLGLFLILNGVYVSSIIDDMCAVKITIFEF